MMKKTLFALSTAALLLVLPIGQAIGPAPNDATPQTEARDEIVCGAVSAPATEGCTDWAAREQTVDNEDVLDLAASPDGDTVVAVGATDWHTSTGLMMYRPMFFTLCSEYVGICYLGTAMHDYKASSFMVAYDGETGERLWRHGFDDFSNGLGEGPWTTVTFDEEGDNVLVAGLGSVISLSAETGALQWIRPTGAGVVEMVVDGDDVYAVSISPEKTFRVVAYDLTTGETQWMTLHEASTDDMPAAASLSPSGDRLYVGATAMIPSKVGDGHVGSDYRVAAFDTATGEAQWSARSDVLNRDVAVDLATADDGDHVYVVGDAAEYSRVVQTLDPRGLIYHSRNTTTTAFEASSGDVAWSQQLGDAPSSFNLAEGIETGPGDRVYVGATQDEAPHIWETPSRGGVMPAPDRPAGGPLHVGDDHISVVAYEGDTGQRLWDRGVDHLPTTATYGSDLVFSDEDRSLYVTGSAVARTCVSCSTPLMSPGDADVFTASLDAEDGSLAWKAVQDGAPSTRDARTSGRLSHAATTPGGMDFATSIAVPENGGKVFVSGNSAGVGPGSRCCADGALTGTGLDAYTLAYPANGPQLLPGIQEVSP